MINKRLDRAQAILDNRLMNEDLLRKSLGNAAYDQAIAQLSARQLPPQVAALEPWEKVALHTWTLDTHDNPWFRRINRVLRNQEARLAEVSIVLPLVAAMQSGLSKLPPYRGVVWRGIKERGFIDFDAFLRQHNEGEDVVYLGFSGASTSRNDALRGRVKLAIVSSEGVDISSLSDKAGQGEVLFSPPLLVKIERIVHLDNGVIEIWARQR